VARTDHQSIVPACLPSCKATIVYGGIKLS
jgi:hypothetical protein